MSRIIGQPQDTVNAVRVHVSDSLRQPGPVNDVGADSIDVLNEASAEFADSLRADLEISQRCCLQFSCLRICGGIQFLGIGPDACLHCRVSQFLKQ